MSTKLPPIHERVRAHVDDAGLTITQIAKRAHWSYLKTMRRLNGDTELSAADMELLARIIKRDVGDLYDVPERLAS